MRNPLSILLVSALVCVLAWEGLAHGGQGGGSWEGGRWYGWQILATDSVSILMVSAAVQRENVPIFCVGAASYLLAPAVIHVVHGNYGRALVSPLMRTILPVGGALLAYELLKGQSDRPDNEYDRLGWTMLSLVVATTGMVAASAVDTRFASESRAAPTWPSPPTSSKSPNLISFTTAGIVPAPTGAQLMFGGRF